jgi:PKD repeat protein
MTRNSRGIFVLAACAALLLLAAAPAAAQSNVALDRIEARAANKPLPSLADAAAQARARGPQAGPPREVMNFRGEGRPAFDGGDGPSPNASSFQDAQGSGTTAVGSGFPGADNNDNGNLLGFLIAPPDTDGSIGPTNFVQMINLLTTIYDKSGNVVQASFPSNAFWAGIGGNCEPYNQGDPIVLYDDQADRWLVSQFAFPDSLRSFSQCVAVSQTGDPTGAYNRYEFSFDGIGFNDYPKHGIVTGSITMIANIFTKRGRGFIYGGTFLGVMDKAAMYAGDPTASLIGFNIGTGEFGFVAGDLDGSGSAPALFATAMSTANAFDIWQIDVDWTTEDASANQIASIPVTPFDTDLCSASREACIPQPDGGPALEAIADRLMHRLQLRDFGTYRTMVTSHTVDVGNGRAGIRWYELRESSGAWSLYQEGTFGPNDGLHRFIPSAAMNLAGDIGIGYLVSSENIYVSTAVAGQSAANSGSGLLDAAEEICAAGSGVQQDVNRSGDYSSTSIDPTTDSFWHTNEVFTSTGPYQWATFVCEFEVGEGGGTTNSPPTAAFSSSCTDLSCDFTDESTDSDGTVVAWSWNFGDGSTSTARNPSHTYADAGTYTVTLSVTDNDNDSDTATDTVTVTEPTANQPPIPSFSSSCTDLSCDFTDESTDSDGTVVAWSWDFGDGTTSTAQNPSHTYASAGTYTVTLTVTDDDNDSDTANDSVTVTDPVSGDITLTVTGRKERGVRYADLVWSGATTTDVDVYRDGTPITTTDNDGAYTDNLGRNSGTFIYQVCEAGTSVCSNEASVTF